jgi:hypothetical protein
VSVDCRGGEVRGPGVDPVACRGMPGYADAALECSHGRLPHDPSPPCGCWVENRPRRRRRRAPGSWTEESVVATVAGVFAHYGRVVTRDEWRRRELQPSAATVERACGSWDAAVASARARLAGGGVLVGYSGHPVEWSSEAVVAAFARAASALGHWPTLKDVRGGRFPGGPSRSTVYRVCGGWPPEPTGERSAA